MESESSPVFVFTEPIWKKLERYTSPPDINLTAHMPPRHLKFATPENPRTDLEMSDHRQGSISLAGSPGLRRAPVAD
jgi:hypothetical protein